MSESRAQYLWYMAGIVTYVAPLGIQMILLPWLIAVELQASADRLGIAQMATQLPGLFLILFGGLLADRIDGRKILMTIHTLATLPALIVAAFLYFGELSYSLLLVYALAMGTINAFVTPTRDGMLNRVAGDQLQRTVTVAMGLQFGAQLIGFTAARAADETGAVPLLLLQAAILFSGVFVAYQLNPAKPYVVREEGTRVQQITRGLSVVWGSNAMRPALLMLTAMSFFYGGTFMVLNPLIVRDIYGGQAAEISLSYSVFVIGTVTSTALMVALGGIRRQGRALLLAIVVGGLFLSLCFFDPSFYGYLALIGGWGLCGGVAMSMSRTIMQEAAPNELRARVMAVFTLGNTGGMPLGALTLGYLAEFFGVLMALAFVVIGIWSFAVIIAVFSNLRHVGDHVSADNA